MSLDLIDALQQIEREKDIPVETLVSTIEAALVSAYRKHFGAAGNIRVEVDFETDSFRVFSQRVVVETPENHYVEISQTEARRIRPDIQIGDLVENEVTPKNFGRIAAQTAKQVMVQRIREAEREIIFEEFSGREGELITGEVQRRERRNVYVNLGKVEALLPPSEQVEGEPYRFGQRLKVYVMEVRKTTKTPQVVVSRSHPGLVRRLFELEVPEIHEGIVELKSVAREAGHRTKIAVATHDANVDPVGACVGHRGARVQAIVDELGGEKIDIVRWNEKTEEFIANSLSPAQVSRVVLNPGDNSAKVLVPEDQLSLAIGRSGQNVRLAARLTGWRIDIQDIAEAVRQAAAAKEAAQAAAETAPVEQDSVPPADESQPAAAEPSAETIPAPVPDAAETEASAVAPNDAIAVDAPSS